MTFEDYVNELKLPQVEIATLAADGARYAGPVTIGPFEYHLLRVASAGLGVVFNAYQRNLIPSYAAKQIAAFREGSVQLGRVLLARRRKSPELWIVDGQHTAAALIRLGLPILAVMYDVDDVAAERRLFLAANSFKTVPAGATVAAWEGPAAALIRDANVNPDHPLFGRVNLTGTGGGKLEATGLIGGIAVVSGAKKPYQGNVRDRCAAADEAIRDSDKRARLFLDAAGRCFPKRAPVMAMYGLASALQDSWTAGRPAPMSASAVNRIKRTDWNAKSEQLGSAWDCVYSWKAAIKNKLRAAA